MNWLGPTHFAGTGWAKKNDTEVRKYYTPRQEMGVKRYNVILKNCRWLCNCLLQTHENKDYWKNVHDMRYIDSCPIKLPSGTSELSTQVDVEALAGNDSPMAPASSLHHLPRKHSLATTACVQRSGATWHSNHLMSN